MTDCPWDLAKEERKAMDDLVEYGSVKASSERSPESLAAVYAAIRRARKKMGAISTVHAALLWDRWNRGSRTPT